MKSVAVRVHKGRRTWLIIGGMGIALFFYVMMSDCPFGFSRLSQFGPFTQSQRLYSQYAMIRSQMYRALIESEVNEDSRLGWPATNAGYEATSAGYFSWLWDLNGSKGHYREREWAVLTSHSNWWKVVAGVRADDPPMLPLVFSRNVGISAEDLRCWPQDGSAILVDEAIGLGNEGVIVTVDYRCLRFSEGELNWSDFGIGTNSRHRLSILR